MTLLATSPCLEHGPCQEAPPQLFQCLAATGSPSQAVTPARTDMPGDRCDSNGIFASSRCSGDRAIGPSLRPWCLPAGVRLRAAVSPPQHVVALPTQEPTEHWSLQVVELPSSQTVPLGWNPFAGQLALVPLQASATSQTPAAGRHTVVLALYVLAGQ